MKSLFTSLALILSFNAHADEDQRCPVTPLNEKEITRAVSLIKFNIQRLARRHKITLRSLETEILPPHPDTRSALS